ncbi:MAG: hypothetical protein FJ272_21155, partial [Planctomycetes bacterium]|nr:hypothetical protein [Planctomycetota bacterium]
MNVLFTIAPWSHTQTLPKTMARKSFLNKKFAMTNSLNYPAGLLYICATLKQAGHTTLYVDGYYNTKEQILGRIEEFKPTWVGVSCIHFSWENTKPFLTEMRQRFPGLKIVIGGYFPSAVKKQCLEECPAVDCAVVGEGEYRSVQLCEALEGKRKMEDVDGLVWRKNGQIVENELKGVIMDLDSIPFPDYDQINFWDYSPAIGSYKALPSAMIFSSRGCKGRCAFCLSNKVVRYRSPDNLIAEITLLRTKYG